MEVCRNCGSKSSYEKGRVSYPLKVKDRVVIYENVPAIVCRQCHETLFTAETVKLMETLRAPERTPSRIEEVAVYDLAEVA